MDGRVKTLHPKIHGGLLGRRDNDSHIKNMKDHGIENIDLLVTNLYPFVETINSGADFDTCIENIDIGGPAMIRAASKNFDFCTVLTNPEEYTLVLDEMNTHDGAITHALRKKLAAHAYALTATYDANISRWFAKQIDETNPQRISFSGNLKESLRYGENPHQDAALYLDGSHRPGVATAKQLQGKTLSYNNLNDTDAAYELVAEFDAPAVVIVKHANPSGVAIGPDLLTAYLSALKCDPISAFGGIIAVNRTLDAATATEILKTFCEVVIAPSIETQALDLFAAKKNIRVLTTGDLPDSKNPRKIVKSIAGGLLVQSADIGQVTLDDLNVVTDREPTKEELQDLLFAFRVAKHVKSNTIVYAKNLITVGIGAGQMSRLDAAKIASTKMHDADLAGCRPVVASDAFFPFADGLIATAEAGATAVIQPGGSIRDDEVIDAANERGLAMVFTGIRHFKH
jgi:phosphoribosylaminoimidazolecarboxamide formyltransferase/IMP cyclohydrolase